MSRNSTHLADRAANPVHYSTSTPGDCIPLQVIIKPMTPPPSFVFLAVTSRTPTMLLVSYQARYEIPDTSPAYANDSESRCSSNPSLPTQHTLTFRRSVTSSH